MISEEHCDTENWRTDAWNSALNHKNNFFYIYIYIKIENNILNCKTASQYYLKNR